MAMIINVSRDYLLAGLASLQNVTGKKGTLAILANVLIETESDAIQVTATDLEVGIRNTIPAEIQSAGTITLPSKKLFEIVRESSADLIHIEAQDNNWVKITADRSSYNLAGMPSDEFPAFPEYNEAALVSIDSAVIKELIDKTIFSVAQEGESQFNLTGILVEKEDRGNGVTALRMISSDGHRLTVMEKETEGEAANLQMAKTTLVPRKGVQELRKISEANDTIGLAFEEKQAVIKSDQALMVIRLMNGDFPDYRAILNSINRDRYIRIERIPFLNSMKRMNLFSEDRYNAVKFSINTNLLVLSSQNMDIGSAKDELPIDFNGDPLQLGFNGRYFVDVLQVLESETVRACISSEESPCLIESEEEPGFVSIVMPMKL